MEERNSIMILKTSQAEEGEKGIIADTYATKTVMKLFALVDWLGGWFLSVI